MIKLAYFHVISFAKRKALPAPSWGRNQKGKTAIRRRVDAVVKHFRTPGGGSGLAFRLFIDIKIQDLLLQSLGHTGPYHFNHPRYIDRITSDDPSKSTQLFQSRSISMILKGRPP